MPPPSSDNGQLKAGVVVSWPADYAGRPSFTWPPLPDVPPLHPDDPIHRLQAAKGYRAKAWIILTEPESSWAARVVYIVIVLTILVRSCRLVRARVLLRALRTVPISVAGPLPGLPTKVRDTSVLQCRNL